MVLLNPYSVTITKKLYKNFNMNFNKSNFMILMWIFLIFLALACAFGRYNGSNSREKLLNNNNSNNFDGNGIPEGTEAYECLKMMIYFCGRETSATADDCAQEGVLHWPRDPNPPNYVQDYFELLRSHITTGNLQLPDEFCDIEANDFYEGEGDETNAQERQLRSSMCKEQLQVFRDLVVTPQGIFGNIYETQQQSRENILFYMLYETKIENFVPEPIAYDLDSLIETLPDYFHVVLYFNHMHLNVQVNPYMPTPKDFCLEVFSL